MLVFYSRPPLQKTIELEIESYLSYSEMDNATFMEGYFYDIETCWYWSNDFGYSGHRWLR